MELGRKGAISYGKMSLKYPLRLRVFGRGGGGKVVSVLAFYSDNPSSNPAEVEKFSVKLLPKQK